MNEHFFGVWPGASGQSPKLQPMTSHRNTCASSWAILGHEPDPLNQLDASVRFPESAAKTTQLVQSPLPFSDHHDTVITLHVDVKRHAARQLGSMLELD